MGQEAEALHTRTIQGDHAANGGSFNAVDDVVACSRD
jgi:hypothetical protein